MPFFSKILKLLIELVSLLILWDIMFYKFTDIVFHNGEHICGVLDKSTLGSGSRSNIFYVILRNYGEELAADRMHRLARMCPVFLSTLLLLTDV